MTLNYDGKIDVAIGKDRKATKWRNRTILWSELVTRLAETHRTAETQAEYLAATVARQAEIKDVGGFVGGYLSNGRRKSDAVAHRSLLTLDADFADTHLWETLTLLRSSSAVVYSTHKHTPDKPRLRLVMPLAREVSSDEYEALARWIACELGIDQFDHTGYQPYRLMYWPSTSKDGEYRYEVQDGPWLDPDDVLSNYRNWQDSSSWPVSDREQQVVRAAMKKQGDPLEKPGVVGAFCRVYSIHDVIERYLADEYEPCAVEGRYTFRLGTTSGGLVTYDDKFAYSHHGTDPACEKLCNAFDLVRIHRFNDLDERTMPDTPPNRRPSYTAMVELALADADVRGLLATERLEKAHADFAGMDGDDSDSDDLLGDLPTEGFVAELAGTGVSEGGEADSGAGDEWLKKLQMDGKGKLATTAENFRLIIENDPRLRGKLALNLFDCREVALGNLPWRKVTRDTMALTDKDDSGLRTYIEKVYGIANVGKAQDALNMVLLRSGFHPVRDYLDKCMAAWDGLSRVDTMLVDYLGAEPSDYTKAVTRCMMVAAVKRIYQPGCKFDNVLVLQGPEGVGKSTLARKLGYKWFTDNFNTVVGKEAYEQLQGSWIVEMGEMAGLKKAEVEHVKQFVSKQEDKHRMAYGKRVESFPRQCVFIGTTNDSEPLREGNGNRRFWVVPVGMVPTLLNVWADLTEAAVVQLWGEAVILYKAGEPVHLSADMEQQAREVQEQHTEMDERVGLVQKYLETLLPASWGDMDLGERKQYLRAQNSSEDADMVAVGTETRTRVCAAEVWCEVLECKMSDISKYNTKEVNKLITACGWMQSKGDKTRFRLYGLQRFYTKPGASGGHFRT